MGGRVGVGGGLCVGGLCASCAQRVVDASSQAHARAALPPQIYGTLHKDYASALLITNYLR